MGLGEPGFVDDDRVAAALQHPFHDSQPVVGLVVEDAVRDAVRLLLPRPHELGPVSGRIPQLASRVARSRDPIRDEIVRARERIRAAPVAGTEIHGSSSYYGVGGGEYKIFEDSKDSEESEDQSAKL